MQFTIRLASQASYLKFPLPIDGALAWQALSEGSAAAFSVWQTTISLPEIPEHHIVVPSYACLDEGYQFQWSLRCRTSGGVSTLTPITAENCEAWSGFAAPTNDTQTLLSKIDCWHTKSLSAGIDATLTLFLPNGAMPPREDLLTISIRSLILSSAERKPPSATVLAEQPAPLSQMQARADIAKRICSPTATVMAVMGKQAPQHWDSAIISCLDPYTNAYGKWPLAIYWASQQGTLGSVEALHDWSNAITVLEAGCPVVCSIRFAKNDLPDAPLTQTAGHLVVLYGIEYDGENGYALVMDPAAETGEDVAQRYPLSAFGDAWLKQRGGAYLFAPNELQRS